MCTYIVIMDSEVLKELPPQHAQSLFGRIIKQQQVSRGEKVTPWWQVAEVDVFQLEVFGEINFQKTKVCLEGTSLHALLTQIVWLGSRGDRRGVFNSKSMSQVNTEAKMSFQIFSSSVLHRAVPWEMFYVVKGPVYLFCHYELWISIFSVYWNFKMQCLFNTVNLQFGFICVYH